MSNQATYTSRAVAFVGQIATQLGYQRLASGVAEAAGGVAFGSACVIGATDRSVKTPAGAGANKWLGVAVRSQDASHITTTDVDKYIQGAEVEYMISGEVWVTVAENVADGDLAYFSELDGTFGKTAGTPGTDISPVPNGAKYLTTALSGALAKLRLN